MHPVPDPYRVLGVARDATASQIKAAHRRLAKRHHPDAPEGDTARFLAIQQAYQVLADPLARRAWDARHQPGPWRADARGTAGVRDRRAQPAPERPSERADGVRGGRATGRATGSGRAAGQRPAAGGAASGPGGRDDDRRGTRGGAAGAGPDGSGRDPAAGSYTWSARDVPWWEEGSSQGSKRQPGRQRPREAAGDGPRSATGAARERSAGRGPRQPRAGTTSGSRPASESGASRNDGAPPTGPEAGGPPAMDVYSRSSGAAWSSAARAYFRRHELPPPGRRSSWVRPGRQEPPRPARGVSTGTPAQSRPRPASAGASARPRANVHDAAAAPPPQAAARGVTSRPYKAGERGLGERGAGSWRGPRRSLVTPTDWPPLPQRLALALLAWAPMALAVAYGGDAVTGCGRGAVGCPAIVPPLQAALAIGLLGLLLLLPRAAYLGAAGTIGLALGSAAGLFIIAVLTAGGTVPELFVTAGFVLAFVGYAVAVRMAARDTPFVRPWLSSGGGEQSWRRGDAAW